MEGACTQCDVNTDGHTQRQHTIEVTTKQKKLDAEGAPHGGYMHMKGIHTRRGRIREEHILIETSMEGIYVRKESPHEGAYI